MSNLTAVETAQQKLEEARAHVETIQQALLDGDEKLRGADLRAAKDEVEFCELRLAAAIDRETKQKETDRRETIKSFALLIPELDSQGKNLQKQLSDSLKPLDAVLSKIVEHNQKIGDVRAELQNLGIKPGDEPVEGVHINTAFGNSLLLEEFEVKILQPKQEILHMVERLCYDHFQKRGS